ncbi:hypothetical protein SAMN04515674_12119 [Pseudarcicella hirudinis]|uniref:DoxX-like family protein n=1 Tax=Pseudarcicella hirudinis TaxID=1079859 RepID=A0A1I5YSW3_9BACT|nr:hypothetical protein [Pseudarcicella hirudinis]SFQ46957.1 hypothetical protein SAMN04515674_12119 [Pseudarcicella hirudinis]
MKIISAILILLTVFFSLKHGWEILTIKPGETNMFIQWNFSKIIQIVIGVLTIASGLFILFPQTFFSGNLINCTIILLIMGFHLKDRNLKEALIEVPFLLIPLIMIYLRHPLEK